jgi:hypothetical protein
VADSNSLRSKRKRFHAAGDHSLCRRCDAVRAVIPVTSAPKLIQTALDHLLEPPEGHVDAQAALQRQAARLEAACLADRGNAALERVLKEILLALRGPEQAADSDLAKFLDEFRRA